VEPTAAECWTSCYIPAAMKGVRQGVRIISVSLLGPSNASVAPSASVSFTMGHPTVQQFEHTLAAYAAVHARSRASTRVRDRLSEMEMGKCDCGFGVELWTDPKHA
jgi:hypothetical protein